MADRAAVILMRRALTTAMLVLIIGCAGVSEVSEVADAPVVTRVAQPPSGDCHGKPYSYTLMGRRYWVEDVPAGHRQRGTASWYGRPFHGRKTASGEIFDMYQVSAAHKTLPLFSIVRVVNLENGREVTVRINDRGPFVGKRLIDLSYAAAKKLGMVNAGVVPVQVTVTKTPSSSRLSAALVDLVRIN